MDLHVLVLFISVLAWSEINLCTAVTVSFTQTSFTVTEGGDAVPVCVTVIPALVGEATVDVGLMSSEGFLLGMHCIASMYIVSLQLFPWPYYSSHC